MSTLWVVVIVVGAATMAIKAVGPLVVAGRALPARFAAVLELLAPSVLAALVVTQVVGGEQEIVFDERLAGVGAAAVALRLRAPLLAVVVLAALVTALLRAAT